MDGDGALYYHLIANDVGMIEEADIGVGIMHEPASEIQDKILFMINNISASNMDVKAREFTDVLKVLYHPWFAQYMVMKRHGRMRSSQRFYNGPSSAWNAVLSSGTSNSNSNTLSLIGKAISWMLNQEFRSCNDSWDGSSIFAGPNVKGIEYKV